MRIRSVVIILFTISLFTAIGFSMMRAVQPVSPVHQTVASLQNIRTFVAASEQGGSNYAVDGGLLYSGTHGEWTQIATPPNVIVSAIAVGKPNSPQEPATLIIGAANGMTLFLSTDGGRHWEKLPVSHEFIGGVTDVALDASQSTLFVATDTAGIFQVHVGSDSRGTVQLDVGSQWPHNKPIVQLAVDSVYGNMVFARTDWELLKLRNTGVANGEFEWQRVVGIDSTPTGIVVVPGDSAAVPATAYVGTADRGVLRSRDGATWLPFNTGLDMGAGAQLRVDALAADPAQVGVLYVATSYALGSRERQYQPAELAYVAQQELPWSSLSTTLESTTLDANGAGADGEYTISALLPVSGETGAVYALTTQSRSPVALGSALPVAMLSKPDAAVNGQPINPLRSTVTWSWAIAGLAGFALIYAVVSDLRRAPVQPGRTIQQTEGGR